MAEGQLDPVTGTLTRGEFNTRLPAALAEAESLGEPLSLIMVDLDYFKRVNDTHGHPAGDAILRETASRLQKVARGRGHVFRYGGEEITVLLANCSRDEALATAERARRELERGPMNGIAVTASFGVASYPEHAKAGEELLEAADKALYDAKNRGRNIVRFFGEPAPKGPEAAPREPERKAPSASDLPDDVKIKLRKQILQGFAIRCPRDQAIFEVHDVTTLGMAGRAFIVVCPDCGLQAKLWPQ